MKKFIILLFISLILVSCQTKDDLEYYNKKLQLEHETDLAIIKNCEAMKGISNYKQPTFGSRYVICEIPGENK